MYAIEVKGGLLKDNATGCPITFYRYTDALIEVAKIMKQGYQAQVITHKEKVSK